VSYIKAETLKRFENTRFVIISYEYFEMLLRFVRFELLTAVKMLMLFWDVMVCGLVTFQNDAGDTGYTVSLSLRYITVREEGIDGKCKGSKISYVILLRLLPCTLIGWPSVCVFVTFNEAWRYLARSVLWSVRYLVTMFFAQFVLFFVKFMVYRNHTVVLCKNIVDLLFVLLNNCILSFFATNGN
jgi:hypothetical protein